MRVQTSKVVFLPHVTASSWEQSQWPKLLHLHGDEHRTVRIEHYHIEGCEDEDSRMTMESLDPNEGGWFQSCGISTFPGILQLKSISDAGKVQKESNGLEGFAPSPVSYTGPGGKSPSCNT